MRKFGSAMSDLKFAEMEDLLWRLGRRLWEMEGREHSEISEMRWEIEAALGCDFRGVPKSWGIPKKKDEPHVGLWLEPGVSAADIAFMVRWLRGVGRAEIMDSRISGAGPLCCRVKTLEDISFFEKPASCVDVQVFIDSLGYMDAGRARGLAIRHYGFAIPCREAMDVLKSLSPLLEVGAGSGHWARLLRAEGADVVATDFGMQGEYSQGWMGRDGVERMSAVDAVAKWPDRNVFVSWPTYDGPWAREMAEKMAPGKTLAYIGDGRRGSTAEDGFFDVLDRDFFESAAVSIPRWKSMSDRLRIFVKR